uniref:Uncharacterized protein N-3 n=1 Tax=Hyposoter didymator TaxID=260305 RepID=D7P5M7_HYPDD|nr:unknown [Hyposoter didymator]
MLEIPSLGISPGSCCGQLAHAVMKNWNIDVCCSLTIWNSSKVTSSTWTFNYLENRQQNSRILRPHSSELNICERQCCQLFDRCVDKTMQPHKL